MTIAAIGNTFNSKLKIPGDLSWKSGWASFYKNIITEKNDRDTFTTVNEDTIEEGKTIPGKGYTVSSAKELGKIRVVFDSDFFFTKPGTAEVLDIQYFPLKKLNIQIEGISRKKEDAFRLNSAYMKKKKIELKELRLKYGIER